jgi:hypothetical protein
MRLAVAGFFGAWFAATCLRQLNNRWFIELIPSALLDYLPLWTFFAPNPGTTDIRLLYRDRDNYGHEGEWIECCRKAHTSKWRFFWNPDKLQDKAVIDLALLLCRIQLSLTGKTDFLMMTWPYLVLLSRTAAEPNELKLRDRQFSILATEGLTEPRSVKVLYISHWHGLEG